MSTLNRPSLPPMVYLLWLPHCGVYVRKTKRFTRQVIGTVSQHDALRLPEEQARRHALALIRRTSQPVELRRADPTDNDKTGGAS